MKGGDVKYRASSSLLKYRLARGSCPLVKYRQEKLSPASGGEYAGRNRRFL